MIKENQKNLNRILVLLDSLIILLSFFLSWYFRFKSGIFKLDIGYLSIKEYLNPLILIIPVYLIIYNILNLYNPYRFKDFYIEVSNIIKSNLIGIFIFTTLLFIYKEIDYSRYIILLFFVYNILFTIIERGCIRLFLRHLRKLGFNLKHCLLIGYTDISIEFLNRINKNPHWGYNVIGFLDNDKHPNGKFKKIKNLGSIKNLQNCILENNIDEVIIALTLKDYKLLTEIINICEKNGIKTQIIPDYLRYIPAKPYVEELDGLPIIDIRHIPLDNFIKQLIKRIFDIFFSLSIIIIFAPLYIVCSIMVLISSPGPIIYRQERVGLNRKIFPMYKFRSMKVQTIDEEKKQWTTKNDPRKTKFGSFMRKTSIDEFPQFFNVLFGHMSIVGPRPERPFFVEKFKEEIPKYMIKHQVRPGITGWAQIHGWRGDTSISKRIEFDLYYIENWTFFLDLKIIFLTVFKGFFNKNAY